MGRMGISVKKKIAVVIACMDVEYARRTLQGVIDEAQENNMDVFVFNAQVTSDDSLKHNVGEYSIYNLIDYSAFDGVVFFANMIQGVGVFNDLVEKIRNLNVMTVCVDTALDGFCHVGIDNYKAMRAIVEHFVEHHGFTRINYISGMDFNTESREREAAYADVLKEHHIPVEEKRIFRGDFTHAAGSSAARKMLASGETLPQAIVCATDSQAMGVRNVFAEHGVRIPEDVAISGFDNTFEARYILPRMTTVDRDLANVGREAIKKIVRKLQGEDVSEVKLFPGMPLFAGSCGCDYVAAHDVSSIRGKYLEMVEQYEERLYECNSMIEDLNESRNLTEFLGHLSYFVKTLGCSEMYLLLDKQLYDDLQFADDYEKEGEFMDRYLINELPERMALVMSFKRGKGVSIGNLAEYDSKQFWNLSKNNSRKCSVYVFSPIHFRDRFMGYMAVANCDFVMKSSLFNTWLINLSNALESLRKQVQLKHMLDKLDKLYVVDPLTKLYNRFGFAKFTSENFLHCAKTGRGIMILFADLDGLKKINDEFGHDKGDVAIKAVADALIAACQEGEICARFGGDEYVVYADGYSDEEAEEFCARLDEQMKNVNAELQMPFEISISYGYEIVLPNVGDVIDKYIDMADNQMYEKKKYKKSKLSHKS